ncbi:hypothetical protein JTE90_020248, partial [Oedothorax gibbosus]
MKGSRKSRIDPSPSKGVPKRAVEGTTSETRSRHVYLRMWKIRMVEKGTSPFPFFGAVPKKEKKTALGFHGKKWRGCGSLRNGDNKPKIISAKNTPRGRFPPGPKSRTAAFTGCFNGTRHYQSVLQYFCQM